MAKLFPSYQELRRNFIISRWKLNHPFRFIQMQGMCLGYNITKKEYLSVIKEYCAEQNEVKQGNHIGNYEEDDQL